MFEESEAQQCPVCGVSLSKLEKLPLSHDALSEEEPIAPENERVPFLYLGRGRGPLLALSSIGMALFFAPWVTVTTANDPSLLSGMDVAHRFGWVWGVAVAWFILVPTVLSRRTIAQMRSARVAAAMLSGIPAMTTAILLSHPPRGKYLVTLEVAFAWPIWATLIVSVLALAFSIRFGGRVDDIKVKAGSSVGHTVH